MPILTSKDRARFWSKVQRGDGCWQWTDAPSAAGYGYFGYGGRNGTKVPAHRIAYELAVGPIPLGKQIDHLCRNRRCVNPAHLEAVTQRQNLLRGLGSSALNARKTRCKRGHPFDDENTYMDRAGRRQCRACRRLHAQRRRGKDVTGCP